MPRSKINNQANIQAKLRWGLLGSSGKMGSEVVRIFSEDASYSKKMQLVFEDSGRNQESLLEKLFESKPKVLLDFSRPEALLPISLALKKIKCRVLVCSTGWTFEQKKIFMKHLGQKNVTWLPNTSEGVSLLIKAVQAVCKNSSPATKQF